MQTAVATPVLPFKWWGTRFLVVDWARRDCPRELRASYRALLASIMQRPRLQFFFERHVVTAILVILSVAILIALGIWRFHRRDRGETRSDAQVAEESQPEKLAVGLSAYTRQAKSGSIIHIQWNPSAQAVRRSPYGILYIYDDGIPSQLRLERRVLDSGSSDYTPESDEVFFHLILPGGRSEGEFLLVVLGSHGAARARGESDRDVTMPNRSLSSSKQ